MDNGDVLTECSAILVYLSDLNPEKCLFLKPGSFERVRGLEWLNRIATEWHKQFVFLFWPSISKEMQDKLLKTAMDMLEKLNTEMEGKEFIFGNAFSVVDAYMFVALDWLNWVDPKDNLKIANYKELSRYVNGLKKRASVLEALEYEANQFN